MPDSFVWIFLLLGGVIVLKFVLSVLLQTVRPSGKYEYVPRETIYTPAELAYLCALRPHIPKTHLIMGKIRLADIVSPNPKYKGKEYISAFNRISAKHVDFVLCERETYRIKGIIELDDSSHRAIIRAARDQIVDDVLTGAGIPILHVKARAKYDDSEIVAQVAQILNRQ